MADCCACSPLSPGPQSPQHAATDWSATGASRHAVVVVGAGVAGLAAAQQLLLNGCPHKSVLVLEAAEACGGRISAMQWADGLNLNIGAHWVAGDGPQHPMQPLLDQVFSRSPEAAARCKLTNFEPEEVPMLGPDGQVMAYDWGPVSHAFSALEALQAEEDISMADALKFVGWQPQSEADRAALWFLVDYEWGCSPSAASLHHTVPAPYHKAFVSDQQRLIASEGGSPDLLQPLVQHVQPHLRLGERVTRIMQLAEHSDASGCMAVTTVDRAGVVRQYIADDVVVTTSLGVLASGSIQFEPPLPEAKTRALARHQCMAQYEVVIAEFPRVFWSAHFPPGRTCLLYAGSSSNFLIHDLSSYYGKPILEFHTAGDSAVRLSSQSIHSTQAELMAVLRRIYGAEATPEPIRMHCTAWGANPLTRGAFSVRPLGMTDAEHASLMQPCCGGRLHFAGDGLHPVHSGYMHAAYLSGLHTADTIVRKWEAAVALPAGLPAGALDESESVADGQDSADSDGESAEAVEVLREEVCL